MNRRSFIRTTAAGAAIGLSATSHADGVTPNHDQRIERTFAIDDIRVTFYTEAVQRPIKALVVADTHLFTDDERGEPYQEYSNRMAAAYNATKHFQTGQPTNPEQSFDAALQHANDSGVDLVALVGDIVSFPSEAAIEWVAARMNDVDCPWLYVAGNHDWHYEGMEGSLDELRAEWTERRLKPLYQDRNPLMAAYDIHGVHFLAIDNSQYEILPDQLAFFREAVSSGSPLVLLVHIPLFAPGRSVGFGCGHPAWGAQSDKNFELERRSRWPEAGHTQTTRDFHREVFAAQNLLGIFAGHIHHQSVDVINGIPQFVTNANAVGAWLDLRIVPST